MYIVEKNQVFGYWTVINSTRVKMAAKKAGILCKCQCGVEKVVDIGRLCRRQTSMCKSCCPIFYRQNFGKGKTEFGQISGAYYYRIKSNAQQRKLSFSVSVKYLWHLFLGQNSKCAISGLPIEMSLRKKSYNGGRKSNPDFSVISASLDRIDSRYGYIEGNVQWVHKVINVLKGELRMDQLYYACSNIVNNLKEKYDNNEPSLSVEDLYIERKVQRLTDEVFSANNSDTSAAQPDVKQVDDIVQTVQKCTELEDKEPLG